jgi:hypothetical protein
MNWFFGWIDCPWAMRIDNLSKHLKLLPDETDVNQIDR